jgi:hypothetical protein
MARFVFGLVTGCIIAAAAPAPAMNTSEERLSNWTVWDGRVLLCKDPVVHYGVDEIRCEEAVPAD